LEVIGASACATQPNKSGPFVSFRVGIATNLFTMVRGDGSTF
jgi:hypothetical protein